MQRNIILAIATMGIAGCLGMPALPGDVEVTESAVTGARYAYAELGFTARVDGTMGLTGSNIKIGAVVFNDGPMQLVVRLDGLIANIEEVLIRIGERVDSLDQRLAPTDYTLGTLDPGEITHSEARFAVERGYLERMTAGTDEPVLVQVRTSRGWIEGDFGSTCSSRWRDRACVAVRKAMAAL